MMGNYTRVCAKCGESKKLKHKPVEGAWCPKCRGSEKIKAALATRYINHKYVSYTYICRLCPKVTVKTVRQGSCHCGWCARRVSKAVNDYIYFDLETMMFIVPKRYFRICEYCPPESSAKQVRTLAESGIKPCSKHKYKEDPVLAAKKIANRRKHYKIAQAKKPKVKKPKAKPRKKSTYVSPEAIARQKEINRQHRNEEAKRKRAYNKRPQSAEDERAMIDAFLKKAKKSEVIVLPSEYAINEASKFDWS